MTYEELSRELSKRPATHVIGLLHRIVQLCSTKPVFKDKAAMLRFVDQAWDEGEVGLAELRHEGTP